MNVLDTEFHGRDPNFEYTKALHLYNWIRISMGICQVGVFSDIDASIQTSDVHLEFQY